MTFHDAILETQEDIVAQVREKFATQVDSQILSSLRSMAAAEGRQIQALVDEALADLVEKRKQARPRNHVMQAYLGSHEKYSELDKKLAK